MAFEIVRKLNVFSQNYILFCHRMCSCPLTEQCISLKNLNIILYLDIYHIHRVLLFLQCYHCFTQATNNCPSVAAAEPHLSTSLFIASSLAGFLSRTVSLTYWVQWETVTKLSRCNSEVAMTLTWPGFLKPMEITRKVPHCWIVYLMKWGTEIAAIILL